MAETQSRSFDLGDILSITTGRLVSTRHMAGVYDILNFMTGESLYTHQLPRVSREAAPILLGWHPQLAAVDASSVNAENWEAWLTEQKATFGESLPVERMDEASHERIDSMSELSEMVHPNKIIPVVVARGEQSPEERG